MVKYWMFQESGVLCQASARLMHFDWIWSFTPRLAPLFCSDVCCCQAVTTLIGIATPRKASLNIADSI